MLRRSYRSYGELLGQTGTNTESLDYIGQRTDAETGLTYLHARYYDPVLGVFLSPDPEEADFNTFGYTHGDPVNYLDPDGLEEVCVTSNDHHERKDDGWVQTGQNHTQCVNLPTKDTGTPLPTVGGLTGPNRQGRQNSNERRKVPDKPCDQCHGDEDPVPSPGDSDLAEAILCGAAPPCGEIADIAVILNKDAATLARIAAVLSLGINATTAGALPNASTLGTFAKTPIAGVITGYAKQKDAHALHQAILRDGHGVSPAAILDAVRNPLRIVPRASNDTFAFYGRNARVALNMDGEIVTVIATSRAGRRGGR